MLRLFSLIFSIAGSTCAGTGVVIALVLGQDKVQPILVAAALGAGIGLVASWLVARKLLGGQAA
jgi:hypothetical protein